jgi:hypothetical protein
MGWREKTFQKNSARKGQPKDRNPYARELSDDKYRQRIKESDKEYIRKKLRIKDVYEYDDPSN